MIALNRMYPGNLVGYVDSIRQDCLFQMAVLSNVEGPAVPVSLGMLLRELVTVKYIEKDIGVDVLFMIWGTNASHVDVRFRDPLPEDEGLAWREGNPEAYMHIMEQRTSEPYPLRAENVWLPPGVYDDPA